MTKEQFIFLIETQKPFEFTYNNVVYNMTYDKNEKGEKVIVFGRLYEGKKYSRMSKEERAKAIKSILDKSAEYAKIKMWTEMGNKYYASKDLYITLKNLGINNVYQGSGGYIKK